MTNQLPKSLWRFYFRYAAKPILGLIVAWALLAIVWDIGNSTWWPISQQKIVALFENGVGGPGFFEHALWTIGLIIGLFLVFDIMNTIEERMSAHWRPTAKKNISEALTNYVHNQSIAFYNNRIPGKINSQINYIAEGFGTVFDFTTIFSTLGVILLNMGLVLRINKYVALVLLGSFIFRVIYSVVMMKPVTKASKTASESSSTLSGHIVDSISGFSIVKLFNGARHEDEYLEPLRIKSLKDQIKSSFFQRIMWIIPMFLWDVLFGAVLILMLVLYMHGNIKVSEIVFTLSVYQIVQGNIGYIARTIPRLVDTIGSALHSYAELNQPIDIVDAPDAKPLIVSRGKIEFRNVYFKYKNKYVLRDFNLTINPGERVGLVGTSGAGKTTLVNLLMRFYDPTRGGIYIDGQNIKEVTQNSLRTAISFIPQDPMMFNRTLRENIAYGKPKATETEIHRAAHLAAADKFINAAEKKYDSLVGDRGIKLSGGQRQRVAIARAFLKNAPILILDEATSALDSETEVVIQSSFEKLASGRTTIAIAHRLSTLRNMDKIVVIESGRVIEQGSHTKLLRQRGEYAKLWKMQSSGFVCKE
ncbi:MAG: ABC transporter ATP-binding protein [Alphaproteobacteria bacterium]|nr:ABC transporter ATP-binding protein [Alphaproteobacteria bacterium]